MTPDHEDRQAQDEWRLMPKKPTEQMLFAAHKAYMYGSKITLADVRGIYAAMFDAAPAMESFGHQSPSEEASAFLRTEGE